MTNNLDELIHDAVAGLAQHAPTPGPRPLRLVTHRHISRPALMPALALGACGIAALGATIVWRADEEPTTPALPAAAPPVDTTTIPTTTTPPLAPAGYIPSTTDPANQLMYHFGDQRGPVEDRHHFNTEQVYAPATGEPVGHVISVVTSAGADTFCDPNGGAPVDVNGQPASITESSEEGPTLCLNMAGTLNVWVRSAASVTEDELLVFGRSLVPVPRSFVDDTLPNVARPQPMPIGWKLLYDRDTEPADSTLDSYAVGDPMSGGDSTLPDGPRFDVVVQTRVPSGSEYVVANPAELGVGPTINGHPSLIAAGGTDIRWWQTPDTLIRVFSTRHTAAETIAFAEQLVPTDAAGYEAYLATLVAPPCPHCDEPPQG